MKPDDFKYDGGKLTVDLARLFDELPHEAQRELARRVMWTHEVFAGLLNTLTSEDGSASDYSYDWKIGDHEIRDLRERVVRVAPEASQRLVGMLLDELDRAQREREYFRGRAWHMWHELDRHGVKAPGYLPFRSSPPDEGDLMRTLRAITGLDR